MIVISSRFKFRSDWSRAASTKPALTPVNLEKWAIIFTSKDRPVVERFCKTMQKLAPGMGIQIRNPAIKPVENDRTDTFLKAISEVVTPETQLVMTVVPQQKSDRYAAIKKLCYMEKPVANQVVLAKTIANEKKFSAVATKVILQMNCKLGGELWACESPVKNLMVVGIDVYHAKGAKSVAGVVASLNDYCTRFHSEVAVHSKNQELLHALPIIFLRSLNNYHDANGKYPDHIVVFRDGVSDGQMSTTEEDEAKSFIRMFSQVGEPRFDSAKDGGAEAQVKVAEEMKKFGKKEGFKCGHRWGSGFGWSLFFQMRRRPPATTRNSTSSLFRRGSTPGSSRSRATRKRPVT